ncbi:MAG: AtpZ/AtpI family protein [Flavobacteriales bacterium]|nr:AtpZ/AtpI family protein [Flavobacteriales bacterium]
MHGNCCTNGCHGFLGAYFGKYLDDKYPMDKKWFTIGLTLLAVGLSLYSVIKQLNKINENEDKK